MAETKVRTAQNQKKNHLQDKEMNESILLEEEIADLEEMRAPQQRTMYDKVFEQVERFATTSLGQFVIKRVDRVLKTIEDTAKWSTTSVKSTVPTSSEVIPLERPLPWIPFLFLIVILRLLRVWLSVGAVMIGNGPVTPEDMVYFMQVRRRKLRAIRVHGLKAKNLSCNPPKSLMTKICDLFSNAICQPGVQPMHSRIVVIHGGMIHEQVVQNKNKESAPKAVNANDDDTAADKDNQVCANVNVQNMTLQEMLDTFSKENSDSDPDFVPDEEEESSDDESETDESEDETAPENGTRNGDHENNNVKIDDDKIIFVKENGGRSTNILPKPITEIKKEPMSDDNDSNEKLMRNGTKDHDQKVAATKQSTKIETPKQQPQQQQQRNTPANQMKVEEQNVEKKSTPGHMSAALASTRLINNAATAAYNKRRRTPIDNDSNNSKDDPNPLPTSQTNNVPVIPDPSSNISANLKEAFSTHTTTWPSLAKRDNTDTLTPATSSEDLFYSPIGSPTEFDHDFMPPSILRPSAVPSSALAVGNGAHSTPISEAETEENDLPAKKHVTLQSQSQNEKQQQTQEQQKPKQHDVQEQQQKQQQIESKQHEEQQQQQQSPQQLKPKQPDEQQPQQNQQQQQEQRQEEQSQQQQQQYHKFTNNRYRGRNRR